MKRYLFLILILLILINSCVFQTPKECKRILVYNEKNEDCRSVCQKNFENWDTTNYHIVSKCPQKMILDHCTCECVPKGESVKDLYYQAHGTYPECGNGCKESHGLTEEICEAMNG